MTRLPGSTHRVQLLAILLFTLVDVIADMHLPVVLVAGGALHDRRQGFFFTPRSIFNVPIFAYEATNDTFFYSSCVMRYEMDNNSLSRYHRRHEYSSRYISTFARFFKNF